MGGSSSNKPLVFVFGGKDADPDSRKRKLSAINTQVAYRAHEQRRAKKTKQKSNPKKEAAKSQHIKSEAAENSESPDVDVKPTNLVSQATGTLLLDEASARHDQRKASHGRQHSFIAWTESDGHSEANTSEGSSVAVEVWSPQNSSQFGSTSTDTPQTPPEVLFNNHFQSPLDPFYRLPMATSERDRWLLQHYFANIRIKAFGTHSHALFCPGRDWVSTYISSLPLCLQWMLIHAEDHLASVGTGSEPTSTIQRKARAYRDLNAVLNDPNMDFDTGCSGIMYAAIMDPTRTKLHLKALDRLLRDSGGIRGFLKRPPRIVQPEHLMTVYAFAECEIPELKDVEAVKSRFFEALRSLHGRSTAIRADIRRLRNRRPWDNLSRQVIDENGVLVPSDSDEHLRYYLKAQEDCFSSECFRSLVFVPYNTEQAYSLKARHFAVLHQLSIILLELGQGYLAQASFLKRLQYVAEMSTARGNHGEALMNAGAMLLVISFARQETQAYFDKSQVLPKGVSSSEAVIDGLKMFGFLKETGRSQVISWLRSWLSLDDRIENEHTLELTDDDLAGLSSEIIESWYADSLKQS